MNLTDPEDVKSSLGFADEADREHFHAERLQLDILASVSQIMEDKGVSKAELARRLDVSKSHVSQLFSVDKMLNLRTLAKLEAALDARFTIDLEDKHPQTAESASYSHAVS